MSKRSKAKAAMCHNLGLGLTRRTQPPLRIVGFNGGDDMLLPPSTMRRILIANAKAQGSNADLIGDDDDDYGYAQAGTYDQDQRTVHSVNDIFGITTTSSDDLFGIGAGMNEEDRDATNAARVGLGRQDHEQDDEDDLGEIGQGDRPATPLDRSRIGVKTDGHGHPLSRENTGMRRVANAADDALIPPTLADMIALNRAEDQRRRRRYDRRTGRMVTNASAPGDSYQLPSHQMLD